VKYPHEHLIDALITQLNNGRELESVLAEHPEQADELRPILAAVAWMRMDIPAPARRTEGKQALMAAAVRRRREVEITQGYINEINAGIPLEEMLERAEPAIRPLIVAAWRMQSTEPPAADPARRQAGKERIMAIATRKRAERQQELAAAMSPSSHLRVGLIGLARGIRPNALRHAFSGVMAMALLAAGLGMGGMRINTAAADSLPGDAFYRVKRIGENAKMIFAVDPARREALSQSFNRARLNEMLDLALDGRKVPALVAADWAAGLDNAYAAIRRLPIAEQEALGAALQRGIGSADKIEALLGNADGSRDLFAWLASAPDPASTEPASAALELPLGLGRLPMPVQRPLPPEDEDDVAAATAVAPAVVIDPLATKSVDPVERVQFVQPAPPRDDDDDGDRTAADQPAGDQPAAEPTDETQFVQPPMDPSDPADPGQGDPNDPVSWP
jgi:hypothetical protein